MHIFGHALRLLCSDAGTNLIQLWHLPLGLVTDGHTLVTHNTLVRNTTGKIYLTMLPLLLFYSFFFMEHQQRALLHVFIAFLWLIHQCSLNEQNIQLKRAIRLQLENNVLMHLTKRFAP